MKWLNRVTILLGLILVTAGSFSCVLNVEDPDVRPSRTQNSVSDTIHCNSSSDCQAAKGASICCALGKNYNKFGQLADVVYSQDPGLKLGICSDSCDKIDNGRGREICQASIPFSCRGTRCSGYNSTGLGVCAMEIGCTYDTDCPVESYCRFSTLFEPHAAEKSDMEGARCTPYPRPGDLCSRTRQRFETPKLAVERFRASIGTQMAFATCMRDENDYNTIGEPQSDLGRTVVPCLNDNDCVYLNGLPSPLQDERKKLKYGCFGKEIDSVLAPGVGICQLVAPTSTADQDSLAKTVTCGDSGDGDCTSADSKYFAPFSGLSCCRVSYAPGGDPARTVQGRRCVDASFSGKKCSLFSQ